MVGDFNEIGGYKPIFVKIGQLMKGTLHQAPPIYFRRHLDPNSFDIYRSQE
jgi:hypothetical protein